MNRSLGAKMKSWSICMSGGILLCQSSLWCQKPFHGEISCHYAGKPIREDLFTFDSDDAAEAAVKRIVKYTGLPPNFTILASNVENAAAVITSNVRYILYSQEFIKKVKKATSTDWAATSILAHEIGHHLSGHTLVGGTTKAGTRPSMELEADKFSGHVLRKMGAPLERSSTAGRSEGIPLRKETSAEATYLCSFTDGVFTVHPDGSVMGNLFGIPYKLPAHKEASSDKEYAWYYVIDGDPANELYLNLLGMSGKARYGVDHQGQVWMRNALNQLAVGAKCSQQ